MTVPPGDTPPVSVATSLTVFPSVIVFEAFVESDGVAWATVTFSFAELQGCVSASLFASPL